MLARSPGRRELGPRALGEVLSGSPGGARTDADLTPVFLGRTWPARTQGQPERLSER